MEGFKEAVNLVEQTSPVFSLAMCLLKHANGGGEEEKAGKVEIHA